jgi:putative MATE family efflux protein
VTGGFVAIIVGAPGFLLSSLGAAPDVIDAGLVYLRLVVGSSMVLAVTIVLDSAMRANRDTRTPMRIAILVTAAKLLGNWLLINGEWGAPKLGLDGAGWATAGAQVIGLLAFLLVLARRDSKAPDSVKWSRLLRTSGMTREVARNAMPGVGERVVLNLGLLSYFWILSHYYGTVSVAAYTIGVPLLSFSWIPGSGYAQACATLVGQQLGARNPEGATATGRRATGLAIATAIPLGLFFAVFRTELAQVFTDDAAVIAALGPFMLALAIGQPFLQLHFTLGGAHRGAGDTWTPLVAASIGNWIFRVPLACLAAIVFQADVVWVWYALVIDHIARAAILWRSFQRGAWRERLE